MEKRVISRSMAYDSNSVLPMSQEKILGNDVEGKHVYNGTHHLDRFKKLIQESQKKYQALLRKKAVQAAAVQEEMIIKNSQESHEHQTGGDQAGWGWFIDPSEIVKYKFQ